MHQIARTATTTQLLLLVAITSSSCGNSKNAETVTVTLNENEPYQYAMATGDEDGARILAQAEHFAVSEIRRDSSTNWSAVYMYVPATDFTGADDVQLEHTTGSDGASAPTRRRLVTIRFVVR